MPSQPQTAYQKGIANRSTIQYLKGLIPRYISYLRNSYIVWVARKRGARVGDSVTMPYKLAKKANSNLTIGNHSAIQTDRIDLRANVKIGNNVIVGADVEIITVSHVIDSPDWEHKPYGITIEDFCWLATRAFILPSCQKIGYGAVIAAGSVVARNISAMEIVAGNPVRLLRMRKQTHVNLCTEALLGNDYQAYTKAHKS